MGCLLLRPRGIGIDSADNPRIFEDLLLSLGAEVVDFGYKQKCCGSYNTVHMVDVVADLSNRILTQAQAAGAEVLAMRVRSASITLATGRSRSPRNIPSLMVFLSFISPS